MNAIQNEQIAPEIVQAIIAQATARGLSINDYLRDLLGLTDGESQELALAEQAQPRNEEMLAIIRRSKERLKDMPVRGSTGTAEIRVILGHSDWPKTLGSGQDDSLAENQRLCWFFAAIFREVFGLQNFFAVFCVDGHWNV